MIKEMMWLTKEMEKLKKEFSNVFTEKLEEAGQMKGVKPMKIYVDKSHPNYEPLHITIPRRWTVNYIK